MLGDLHGCDVQISPEICLLRPEALYGLATLHLDGRRRSGERDALLSVADRQRGVVCAVAHYWSEALGVERTERLRQKVGHLEVVELCERVDACGPYRLAAQRRYGSS